MSSTRTQSLQVKYEQQFVGGLTAQHLYLGALARQRQCSLEGNTPSPQDGNNPRADYAQSDYNLPVATFTSLVLAPFGRGRRFASSSNGVVNTVIEAGR